MIIQKTREEIELMRESALIVSKTLGMIAREIKPGVTTLYLDKMAEEFIRDHGAVPSFLGLYGFPNSLCMSPNSQVVHGIPNTIPLESGDVISVDCGVLKNGFYGDHVALLFSAAWPGWTWSVIMTRTFLANAMQADHFFSLGGNGSRP